MKVTQVTHVTGVARIVRTAVKALSACSLALCLFTACSSLQVAGNEDGSEPINSDEQRAYMKAVRRCHKMGGSRVVKVQGELRCF
ncbi:MAG: hypothetical protein RIQ81_1040 [Pseudomonadota bacterium]|jgi:hypothetical protein